MEKRIQERIHEYFTLFRDDFKKYIQVTIENEDTQSSLMNYIENYPILQLDKEDFMKRKRVKNNVPYYERCMAYRANTQQCTRRRKKDCLFCGTHTKSQPHGIVSENNEKTGFIKIVISQHDIHGIMYYLDDKENVYDPTDIMNGSKTPRIIAKYIRNEDGSISIPEFEI